MFLCGLLGVELETLIPCYSIWTRACQKRSWQPALTLPRETLGAKLVLMLRRFAWRRTVGTGPALCSSWETKAWATIATCTSKLLLPWAHLWALLDDPFTSFSRPTAPKGS